MQKRKSRFPEGPVWDCARLYSLERMPSHVEQSTPGGGWREPGNTQVETGVWGMTWRVSQNSQPSVCYVHTEEWHSVGST